MKGLEYITDEKGKKKAIVINYDLFGEYWEEIEDILKLHIKELRNLEFQLKK